MFLLVVINNVTEYSKVLYHHVDKYLLNYNFYKRDILIHIKQRVKLVIKHDILVASTFVILLVFLKYSFLVILKFLFFYLMAELFELSTAFYFYFYFNNKKMNPFNALILRNYIILFLIYYLFFSKHKFIMYILIPLVGITFTYLIYRKNRKKVINNE